MYQLRSICIGLIDGLTKGNTFLTTGLFKTPDLDAPASADFRAVASCAVPPAELIESESILSSHFAVTNQITFVRRIRSKG